jgi:cell division septum initiation protein DivIVA
MNRLRSNIDDVARVWACMVNKIADLEEEVDRLKQEIKEGKK